MQPTSLKPEIPVLPNGAGTGIRAIELPIAKTNPQAERRRALVVPREHGAWGMLLIPMATGAAVGRMAGGRPTPVLLLTTAVMALFWLRTPAESWLGTSVLRAQTAGERLLVRNTALPLAVISAVSLSALFWQGKNRELIWLGMIAAVAFGAQMWLKKMGRKTRMPTEIVGAVALTATAPAAYYVMTGRLDATAWSLWIMNWLLAADQVHFVWLRIRGSRAAGWKEKLTVGWSFMTGQILLVGVLILASYFAGLPRLAPLAFGPILFRGCMWFATKPQPIVVRRLGWTELANAVVFGLLLIAAFRWMR